MTLIGEAYKTKGFIKKKEDFICKVCGMKVVGTGYTNHCPKCLFSKHVDELSPGDRSAGCGGLMAPLRTELKAGRYIIIHKCQKCGKVSKNKAAKNDNQEELIKLL